MNGEWIKHLENARGISEFVFSISLDIRGYTHFCQSIDSVDVATYIKKLYLKILNEYYPNAVYSKPMGDGLFIVIPYLEEDLVDKANTIVESSINLINAFSTILSDDKMITYKVPEKVGVGLTRGSACCIASETDHIIDYSGKTLNHSARLLDKARPHGLVLDYQEFYSLLKPELLDQFEIDAVCLRGISEQEPKEILLLKETVKINEKDRRPINEPIWHTYKKSYSLTDVKTWKNRFRFHLDKKVPILESLSLEIVMPSYHEGQKREQMNQYITYEYGGGNLTYTERGGKPVLVLRTKQLLEEIVSLMLVDDDVIQFFIRYTI